MTAIPASAGTDTKPRSWDDQYSREGFEQWASTLDFAHLAACKGDDRFVQRELPERILISLIEICNSCPVEQRCLLWAQAQITPVGFAVAGGRRWKAWNCCAICGKRVRGTDRCGKHMNVGDPIGTIAADGTGRDYRILADDH